MSRTVTETHETQSTRRTYQGVAVTRQGSLDGVQIFAYELREPGKGEARIRVLASGVHQDDVAACIGNRPFLPTPPFTPGYDMVGVVDRAGSGVSTVTAGDRVAALTVLGSHAEYVYIKEEELIRVPMSLDPAEAVLLILNYLVPYQILHRVVQPNRGETALVIGASGGVGTAFLQLGKLADLTMYGTASRVKSGVVTELGATPIDYHTQDIVEAIHEAEPEGVNYVFNGMGEEYIRRGMAALRPGGTLVHYGAPTSKAGFARLLGLFALFNIIPDRKSLKGYGTHRVDQKLLKEDWTALFKLLEDGEIKPVIARRFRLIDDATPAYALLAGGSVAGNVVMVAQGALNS